MIFEGCGQDNPYPTKQNEKSVILLSKRENAIYQIK